MSSACERPFEMFGEGVRPLQNRDVGVEPRLQGRGVRYKHALYVPAVPNRESRRTAQHEPTNVQAVISRVLHQFESVLVILLKNSPNSSQLCQCRRARPRRPDGAPQLLRQSPLPLTF